ncbi:YdcH family protein [Xanthomonas massiliensis]|jgi:uncharacterized protein YdcH (DUF465 family)|uniref:YdcH family protein n=1 Tax=Xanthomonas massiliensis TaxID=1720302 RepID=UPI0008262AB0|nr:YdcH family protein [Xanthomonas massiliensis]
MFPEYRDLITRLKGSDERFTRLFDEHNALDHQVRSLETGTGTQAQIEALKKQKLALKDQLYAFLQKAAGNA